jgi:hypothetical protein
VHANLHTTDDIGLEPTIYCIQGVHANLHTTDDPGLEPTIYCIQGGHADFHTTDAVFIVMILASCHSNRTCTRVYKYN